MGNCDTFDGIQVHRTTTTDRVFAASLEKEPRVSDVIVVIGAGSIGQAIARRVSSGKKVVLADVSEVNVRAAAEVLLDAGFDVGTSIVDVLSRSSVAALVELATGFGDVTGLIHAAGVSPSQASPATILAVDLYGTALVLEEFGNVMAKGGAGVVISSQSGHRLGALSEEQNAALATTPTEDLLALPLLQPDRITDSLHAYQLAKRANSLRVMAAAVRWGERGARINAISPGIIFTPVARDELSGPRGEGYRRMIELCPIGRGATPDEVGVVGHFYLVLTVHSLPAATSCWTVASPPPTSTVSSPLAEQTATWEPFSSPKLQQGVPGGTCINRNSLTRQRSDVVGVCVQPFSTDLIPSVSASDPTPPSRNRPMPSCASYWVVCAGRTCGTTVARHRTPSAQ